MLLSGQIVLKISRIPSLVFFSAIVLAGCSVPGDSISSPPAVPIIPAAPPAGDSLPQVEGNAILDDPEEETAEWEDYVWADTPRSAWQKCRAMVERYTQNGGSSVDVVKVRESGRGRYRCTFKG